MVIILFGEGLGEVEEAIKTAGQAVVVSFVAGLVVGQAPAVNDVGWFHVKLAQHLECFAVIFSVGGANEIIEAVDAFEAVTAKDNNDTMPLDHVAD